MGLVGSMLRGTDWSQVTEYLSPVFFQIVPPLAMAGQISTLTGDYLNKSHFAQLCTELGPKLDAQKLPTPEPGELKLNLLGPSEVVAKLAAQARGHMLLKLYFWQLINERTVILDLRFQAFTGPDDAPGADSYRWRPNPLYAAFEPHFISAIRDLYVGFYRDEPQRLDQGLSRLQLTHAKQLFIDHFGANQDAQRFELAAFRSIFHRIFLSCKEAKTRLHPNFLPFGAGLFCLYEHLEKLGGSYDVRGAFLAAAGEAP